jgi:hypothetical protein
VPSINETTAPSMTQHNAQVRHTPPPRLHGLGPRRSGPTQSQQPASNALPLLQICGLVPRQRGRTGSFPTERNPVKLRPESSEAESDLGPEPAAQRPVSESQVHSAQGCCNNPDLDIAFQEDELRTTSGYQAPLPAPRTSASATTGCCLWFGPPVHITLVAGRGQCDDTHYGSSSRSSWQCIPPPTMSNRKSAPPGRPSHGARFCHRLGPIPPNVVHERWQHHRQGRQDANASKATSAIF